VDAGAGGASGSGGGAALRWFRTCGDPVCRVAPDGGAPDSGVAACGAHEGDACSSEGELCDPGIGCNVKLVCASKSPIGAGGCPISRRAAKQEIRYLDDAAIERLATELRALRLATYRYRTAPERERLGFILDDAPASFAADPAHDQVDLYGYLSLAVAAVQSQGKRLDAQEREIAALREALSARGATPASTPRRTARPVRTGR
jgi:hypothetical protein